MIWILILATWEAAYRFIGWKAWVFPAPSHIFDSLFSLLDIHTAFGEPLHRGWPWPAGAPGGISTGVIRSPLVEANIVSAVRLIIGFFLSILLGGTLGVLMWRFKTLDEFLGPLFLGLQTLPSVCWVPLAIIAFGLTEEAVQFVLVMGSFFAIAISLRDGLRTIPPLYQRAGMMMGAHGWRLYRYVLLPASLPALASGLRQGFSFAWRSLMGAEFVFIIERHGLGYLLQAGRDFNDVAQVMAIMIVMVVLGMIADRLAFAKLEQRVYRRFGLAAAR
ncbi:MAG TPA: ABC transporter permease [Tepidisphaeraceae bacterium]|nr:ABC transporter permease [Tepidisphaeraceae bacterium]